ncbi:hypothetical protein LTR78_008781 [Recurvomyces mirabilis]|uniref:FAD-binding domain-containing protein n=2 Tax=Recurvomyces mirabilis TaxID=574656 RepID=A0AAE0WIV6_9PEZI|nr:hypothetical protein LTR78_008781 [Recurvomyces mirabilis]
MVVGAGPSGILLALLLARQGITVTVVEKSTEYDKQPRASFYSYPATFEFKRAGIYDEVAACAFHGRGVSWRYLDGTKIASLPTGIKRKEAEIISLPLDELIPLIASHLEREPSAKILLGHEVLASGQDEDHAWIDVRSSAGEQRLKASYLVGADGGSSKIRHDLFGKNFPGRTWDKQIVATNVRYPGLEKAGWETSSNFMVHPEHFHMVARMTNDNLLRVTYAEQVNLTRDEMLARQPGQFKAILPGSPGPNEYELINFSPYKIHQRLAEQMRVGRILLVADAAHLCNPFGGMGLTGGFADVGGAYDCLYGIYAGRADDSILDKYNDVRREKYTTIIDPISSSNIRRLWDPEAIEKDEFIQMLHRAETDKDVAYEMAGGATAVMHDFTQYYDKVVPVSS